MAAKRLLMRSQGLRPRARAPNCPSFATLLGWVSTFMDCMFDINNKKGIRCHLLYFEPFKIMVAYQTTHKFNSQ